MEHIHNETFGVHWLDTVASEYNRSATDSLEAATRSGPVGEGNSHTPGTWPDVPRSRNAHAGLDAAALPATILE